MARKAAATAKGKAMSKAPEEPAVPYEPTERERAVLAKQAARKAARSPRGRITVKEQSTNYLGLQALHEDPQVADALLCESLGTDNGAFASLIVEQLARLSLVNENISTKVLDSHLAMVQEIEPRDAIEAMLAAQMAVVHMLTMNEANCAYAPKSNERKDANLSQINKLGRTFAAQMEALKKHRNKGEQKVVVEHRHYHLAPGAQAVFGDVQAGGGVGVATENGGQSHERTDPMRIPERPAMLGFIEADGVPVPGSSPERQERVPVSRGKGRRSLRVV